MLQFILLQHLFYSFLHETNALARTGSGFNTNILNWLMLKSFTILSYANFKFKGKGKGKDIAVRIRNHHTATGSHMPYRITQCYLPPGSGDFPAFNPAELVLDLATSEGCKAELTWVVAIFQDSFPAKYGYLSQK